MNKILYFNVKEVRYGTVRRIQADEYHVDGEYVEFYVTEDGVAEMQSTVAGNIVVLPGRRLLTVVHGPQEVTPVYEEEEA